jgi:hypothetical protein
LTDERTGQVDALAEGRVVLAVGADEPTLLEHSDRAGVGRRDLRAQRPMSHLDAQFRQRASREALAPPVAADPVADQRRCS